MERVVVTSGEKFVDIDAVGCAIAYAELLRLQGNEAFAVFPGPLNHSVTPMVRSLGLPYEAQSPEDIDGYVIVDTSDPDNFATCVQHDKIIELFDHHDGFQDYWYERLSERSHIDMIGAAATLIWEAYERAGLQDRISPLAANLLSLAIVSNSLNFKFSLTSDRDHHAFRSLAKFVTLGDNWIERYFQEVEASALANLSETLRNDTKLITMRGIEMPVAVGQLELWAPEELVRFHKDEIATTLTSLGSDIWMLNATSMRDGTTLFVTPHPELQTRLSTALGIAFEGDFALADTLYLRKTYLPKIK